MAVFDDILSVEKEALQSIESAKADMVELVSASQTEHRAKIKTEAENFASAEVEALEQHKSEINKKTETIKAEVEERATEVTEKFTAKASSLKQEIIQNLSK